MFELATVHQILVLSAILYWLRAAIDQQKGVVLEALAVTVPIALAAGFFVVGTSLASNLVMLGHFLTPFVVFVFLALPALGFCRFVERLAGGEQPQLADMFRLTTITSLSTFVLRQLEIDFRAFIFVSVMAAAFLAGDFIFTRVERWQRAQWLVIAAVLLLFVAILTGFLNLSRPRREIAMVMELRLPVLLGLLLSPGALHPLMDFVTRYVTPGYFLQSLQHRFVRPADAIYHRTLFQLWRFRPGVCFLNHGSFGAVPLKVQRVQRAWIKMCQAEPMDILARKNRTAMAEVARSCGVLVRYQSTKCRVM